MTVYVTCIVTFIYCTEWGERQICPIYEFEYIARRIIVCKYIYSLTFLYMSDLKILKNRCRREEIQESLLPSGSQVIQIDSC